MACGNLVYAKLAPQASFEPKNGFVQFIAILRTLFSVFRTSISLKKQKEKKERDWKAYDANFLKIQIL